MIGPLIATAVILGASGGVVGLMWAGWKRRERVQGHLPEAPSLPEGLAAPEFALDDVHYVATSRTGDALDRIVVKPLAFRGRARIETHSTGVAVGVTGERPWFIPAAAIEAVAPAQVTIDRAVERDGLVAIRWQLTPADSVESYFRVVNPAERKALFAALEPLIPTSEQSASDTIKPEELA